MKHIVFVLGSYFPRFSAVGICAHRVIEVLKNEFKISVVAIADDQAAERHVAVGGVDIYRVRTADSARRTALLHEMRHSPGVFTRTRLFALRVRASLRRLLSPVTVDRALVEAYRRQLAELPEIDVIVPLVFPFESVLAALEYTSSGRAAVVPYLFDNFVDSRSLHVTDFARKLKRRRHLKLEADMIERSTAILAMHPLRRHFRENFGSAVETRIQFLEHPLLVKNDGVSRNEDSGAVRFVYTGALVRHVREPHYVLDMLRKLDLGLPARADFYVMGNAAAQVETGKTDFGIAIRNHGQVGKDEANQAVAQGTILLNIGEIEGRQISSKVFEYMAAGKPVVHFAYTDDDVVSKILARYPLALSLVQCPDRMEANRKKMRDFVRMNNGKTMGFDEVASIFTEALPETTAQLISGLLLKDRVARQVR